MRKPDTLRALLVRTVPHLHANPDALALFVDEGRVAARAGGSLSFEYRYTLNVVIQDFAGDRNAIVVPLLAWIAQAQPELLAAPDGEPFTFESELLDAHLCDLSIKVQLTERVAVIQRPSGGYEVNHLAEQSGADIFPGVCDQNLWQLFLHDVLIAQTSDPAFTP